MSVFKNRAEAVRFCDKDLPSNNRDPSQPVQGLSVNWLGGFIPAERLEGFLKGFNAEGATDPSDFTQAQIEHYAPGPLADGNAFGYQKPAYLVSVFKRGKSEFNLLRRFADGFYAGYHGEFLPGDVERIHPANVRRRLPAGLPPSLDSPGREIWSIHTG